MESPKLSVVSNEILTAEHLPGFAVWCFLRFFLMWTIFKVFIEFVTVLFLLSYSGCLAARRVAS